jgi:hypothetical protein
LDCSGFVGWVLEQIAPQHYKTIPIPTKAGRPLAFEFYERFSTLPPAERMVGDQSTRSRRPAEATSLPGSPT